MASRLRSVLLIVSLWVTSSPACAPTTIGGDPEVPDPPSTGSRSTVPASTPDVELGTHPPGPECTQLGNIVGKGGGGPGGIFVANEDLVYDAFEDLKQKAAALGANYVQRDSPELGTYGMLPGNGVTLASGVVANNSAVVSAVAYHCDKRRLAATSPKRVNPTSEPPTGAAGVIFGQPFEDVEKLCEQHGGVWTAKDPVASCSKPAVDLGFDATLELEVCSGRVCRIDILVPSEQKSWVENFAKLKRRLEDRYGQGSDERHVPNHCTSQLSECLAKGLATLTYRWRWMTRHGLSASMVKTEAGPVTRLSYTSPEWKPPVAAVPPTL